MKSYTLNQLYNQGIIDYVPLDLCNNGTFSTFNGMQNPYLNSAMQGALYQQHGNGSDSFVHTNTQQTNTKQDFLSNNNIGRNTNLSQANSFGFSGIGSQSAYNPYGFNNIGSQTNTAGIDSYGFGNIGSESNVGGKQIWGGFGDAEQNISSTAANISSKWNNTPTVIKGLLSATMIVGSLMLLFKGKKKVPQQVEKQSFWSKLNPFKKKHKN